MWLAELATARFLEAGMLALFGTSWPAAIYKTLRSKTVAGQSLLFLALVFIGYLSGLGAKIVTAVTLGRFVDWVAWLYVIDGALVGMEIVLYLHYSRRSKASAQIE